MITFKTKSVEKKGDQIVLIADFTIRGVTQEVRLPVKLNGPIKDQDGKTRIGLEGKLTINRKDYGMNFHAVLETGLALATAATVLVLFSIAGCSRKSSPGGPLGEVVERPIVRVATPLKRKWSSGRSSRAVCKLSISSRYARA